MEFKLEQLVLRWVSSLVWVPVLPYNMEGWIQHPLRGCDAVSSTLMVMVTVFMAPLKEATAVLHHSLSPACSHHPAAANG